MSIIYSYPEQSTLNAGDMLIGTSVEKVGGKQKNVTKNFTIQQIADFINRGAGFVDPVATDFQIPVFNQGGLKITGSIMSQDSSPSNGVAGTGITIAGNLTTTGNITTNANLSAFGVVTLGSQNNLISLNSTTKLGGAIQDSTGTLGDVNQILLSTGTGSLLWQNYAAGLTYQGVWDAAANTPTLTPGTGTNGHFYIVDVAGNTILDGNTDWQVGDWALFSGVTGSGGFWDKIDNTQSLTGTGTASTMAMWTSPSVIGDSIITQNGTVVSVAGILRVNDTIESTTANTNLKIQGNGTGAVEVRGFGGVTGPAGRIQFNCSNNNHGVSIQGPPHSAGQNYTLTLPVNVGSPGQVLTTDSAGTPSQLSWSTPTTGTVTSINYTTDFTAFTAGPGTAITTAGVFTLNKNGGTVGQYIDGAAGAWVDLPAGDTYDLGSGASGVSNSIELKLTSGSGTDNSAVTLTGGTGITVAQAGDVVTLTGSAQGVTSLATGSSDTITLTGTGAGPFTGAVTATANTTAGVALGNANLATGGQIQSAIDSALSGAITFKGTFNANTGSITGTSDFLYNPGVNSNTIAVAIGDMYVASVAGNFFNNASTPLSVGDEVIATVASTISPSVSVESNYSAVPSSGGAFLPLSGGTLTGGLTGTSATFAGVLTVGNSGTSRFTDTNAYPLQLNRGLDVDSAGANGAVLGIGTLKAGTYKDGIRIIGALQTNGTDGNFALETLGGNVYTTALAIDQNQQSTFSGDVTLSSSSVLNFTNSACAIARDNNDLELHGYNAIVFGVSNNSYPTSTERMRITSAGKVGIGTTLPAVSLDISATDAVQMPKGTTAQRPTAAEGMLRYSTTDNGFEGYIDGAWGTIGGSAGGASVIVTGGGAGDGTTTSFPLGDTPSGGAISFVDVFIDGVYQNESTYTVSGTNVTITPAPPAGTTIQTKTTTGSNSGAAVTSVNGLVGAVNLRIVPNFVTAPIAAQANNLYIFDSTTTAYTVTLPGSPSLGDSIKISNRGGLATNVLGANSNNIMGASTNLTINNATAAFEIIWAAGSQGWIIIGNV